MNMQRDAADCALTKGAAAEAGWSRVARWTSARPTGEQRAMRGAFMTGLIKFGAIGWMMSCLAAGAAWGQDSNAELKKQLLALAGQGESSGLTLSYAPAVPTVFAAPVPEPTPEPMFDDSPTGTNVWLKTIKLSGFADVGYTKNFNDPRGNPGSLTNPDRMFDTTSNGFLLNMAEVMLEKVASSDSPAGI